MITSAEKELIAPTVTRTEELLKGSHWAVAVVEGDTGKEAVIHNGSDASCPKRDYSHPKHRICQ